MIISIQSIEPDHYSEGTHSCTITYKAKSSVAGEANVSFELSGSSLVNFIEEGGNTKFIGPETINLNSNYSIFTKVTKIKVGSSPSPIAAGFIRVKVEKGLLNDFDTKNISYD